MTADVVTATPEIRAAEALDLMTRRGIRRLPVLRDDGTLVGIVTRADLLRTAPLAAACTPVAPADLLGDATVGQLMCPNPLTVTSDLTIEETAVRMRDHKIGALPVVDRGALIGIITESDVFDALIRVMGLRSGGTRLTIKQDNGATLEQIAKIVQECQARILSLTTYRLHDVNWVVVRVDARVPLHLIQSLVEHGVNLIHLAPLPGTRTLKTGKWAGRR